MGVSWWRAVTLEQERALALARARLRLAAATSPVSEVEKTPKHPLGAFDVGDAAQSFALTGVPEGVAMTGGMLGDLPDLAHQTRAWGDRQLFLLSQVGRPRNLQRRPLSVEESLRRTAWRPPGRPSVAEQYDAIQRGEGSAENAAFENAPTSAMINEAFQQIGGRYHQPTTVSGEYGRTIGQFAGGALIPGSASARVARVALPGALSETGGQLTRGTDWEGPARLAGGVGGGILAEAGVGARARAESLRQPPASEALERDFAPFTRGERRAVSPTEGGMGSPGEHFTEQTYRHGTDGDIPQAILGGFDAERVATLRNNATSRIALRPMPNRAHEPISHDANSAGTGLVDTLRERRQLSRDAYNTQYNLAFEGMEQERVAPATPTNRSVIDTVTEAADGQGFDLEQIPVGARSALRRLSALIDEGGATQGRVERARQELNRELGTAVNARDDAAEFRMHTVIGALDDWRATTVRNPEVRRAVDNARAMFRETAELFGEQQRPLLSSGHRGRGDPGGRALGRALDTEMTGAQYLNSVLGNGQQALSAAQKIFNIGTRTLISNNPNAPSGVRVAGRSALGRRGRGAPQPGELNLNVKGSFRFAADDPSAAPSPMNPEGGTMLPNAEVQHLREGFLHRVLAPLDDYLRRAETGGATKAGIPPFRTVANDLDAALNKTHQQVLELIFRPGELAEMRRLQRWLNTAAPPAGSNPVSSPAMLQAIGKAAAILFDIGTLGAGQFIRPVVGEMMRGGMAANTARRAVRPLPPAQAPVAPAPPALGIGASGLFASQSAMSSAPPQAQQPQQGRSEAKQGMGKQRYQSAASRLAEGPPIPYRTPQAQRPMPRVMRSLDDRSRDPNAGVRGQAFDQLAGRDQLQNELYRTNTLGEASQQSLDAGQQIEESTGVPSFVRGGEHLGRGEYIPALGEGAIGALALGTLGRSPTARAGLGALGATVFGASAVHAQEQATEHRQRLEAARSRVEELQQDYQFFDEVDSTNPEAVRAVQRRLGMRSNEVDGRLGGVTDPRRQARLAQIREDLSRERASLRQLEEEAAAESTNPEGWVEAARELGPAAAYWGASGLNIGTRYGFNLLRNRRLNRLNRTRPPLETPNDAATRRQGSEMSSDSNEFTRLGGRRGQEPYVEAPASLRGFRRRNRNEGPVAPVGDLFNPSLRERVLHELPVPVGALGTAGVTYGFLEEAKTDLIAAQAAVDAPGGSENEAALHNLQAALTRVAALETAYRAELGIATGSIVGGLHGGFRPNLAAAEHQRTLLNQYLRSAPKTPPPRALSAPVRQRRLPPPRSGE